MATDSVQWTCLDAPTLGPRMSHDPRSVGLARHLSTEHAATRTYTGSSPLARRNIATASPAPQRGYHGATTRLLRELLRGYYGATTRLLRGYYEATTRLLPGHYQATTRLLQGYYQEPPARHSASGTAAAAPLVCRRRSSRQLGAGVDDPHTERKISMRPFSMCRTSWPTPKTKHATCPCAAGCRWSASQPAHRPRRRARARRASWAGPGAPRRICSRWTGSSTSQQQPWCFCWTQPRSATAVQHKADGQQARDEQQ